jgi:glycosyltransferase involved in cell wall biosynthesis
MEKDAVVKPLFLLTAPPPEIPGTDAVQQEVEHLQSIFGGERCHIGPSFELQGYLPRFLYGWLQISRLRQLEQKVDLIHVYHSDLYLFPILRRLKKPILYSVASGLHAQAKLPSTDQLKSLGAITVPCRVDLDRLRQNGLDNAYLVPPGIDVEKFDCWPPPPKTDFILLAGSAPWTKKQFHTKGFDALLRVTRQIPGLRLVLLWRGLLVDEAKRRINAMGLDQRVEIVDQWVEVSQLHRRTHAAVVLADKPKLVKAFPHSLLEALACGRPVLVSDCISMAGYVMKTGCGQVVRGVDESDLAQKIQVLKESYETATDNARRVRGKDFSIENLIKSYRKLYNGILEVEGASTLTAPPGH